MWLCQLWLLKYIVGLFIYLNYLYPFPSPLSLKTGSCTTENPPSSRPNRFGKLVKEEKKERDLAIYTGKSGGGGSKST